MSTTWYDTFTTLGFLAGVTERVRLLSHVFVPIYRHPLVTAKALLTLDELSQGRAILGVGAGHVEGEFDMLGVDFAGRGQRLDESVDVVRAALLDEWPEFHGARFDVADVGLRPRPRQTPRPPIWVGGSSPAALRRAGERGDGWLPQGNPPKKYPGMIETFTPIAPAPTMLRASVSSPSTSARCASTSMSAPSPTGSTSDRGRSSASPSASSRDWGGGSPPAPTTSRYGSPAGRSPS